MEKNTKLSIIDFFKNIGKSLNLILSNDTNITDVELPDELLEDPVKKYKESLECSQKSKNSQKIIKEKSKTYQSQTKSNTTRKKEEEERDY